MIIQPPSVPAAVLTERGAAEVGARRGEGEEGGQSFEGLMALLLSQAQIHPVPVAAPAPDLEASAPADSGLTSAGETLLLSLRPPGMQVVASAPVQTPVEDPLTAPSAAQPAAPIAGQQAAQAQGVQPAPGPQPLTIPEEAGPQLSQPARIISPDPVIGQARAISQELESPDIMTDPVRPRTQPPGEVSSVAPPRVADPMAPTAPPAAKAEVSMVPEVEVGQTPQPETGLRRPDAAASTPEPWQPEKQPAAPPQPEPVSGSPAVAAAGQLTLEPLRTAPSPAGVSVPGSAAVPADQVLEQVARLLIQERPASGERPATYGMSIRLHPEELGSLELSIRVTGKDVTTVIQATNPAALQTLSTHAEELRQALQQAGLNLAAFQLGADSGQSQGRGRLTEELAAAWRRQQGGGGGSDREGSGGGAQPIGIHAGPSRTGRLDTLA